MSALQDRRAWLFAILVVVLGLPAAGLRILCIGIDCEAAGASDRRQPFCGLSSAIRSNLAAGYYDGRSPEVLAVTTRDPIVRSAGTWWPNPADLEVPVPIVMSGTGFREGISIDGNPTLDQIAPTIAETMDLERPHPEVRSGRPIPEVTGAGIPSLTVLMVAEGISSSQAQQLSSVRWLASRGAASYEGRIGSLPVDPTSALTTIGTGARPAEHGITESFVRDGTGRMVAAWGRRSPTNVVATLGDHMDELSSQRAEIGLVGSFPRDRGLIGGLWYPNHDRDDVLFPAPDPKRIADSAVSMLADPKWGSDGTTDLLAVALRGEAADIDEAMTRIMTAAQEATGEASFVFTAVGNAPESRAVRARSLIRTHLDDPGLVERTGAAGIYLDQKVMAERQASDNEVISRMRTWEREGEPILLDVFPARAVVLGRYC